jgi:predicted nuclease with RNAse H fold
MKIIGIDLAGSPKNETGFCILDVTNDGKIVKTSILHSNSEIMEKLKEASPDIIAVDAPLIFSGVNRPCDDKLREYGALPVTLRGMEVLARRGSELAKDLKREGFRFIEVFSTASAKILGFHDAKEIEMQKKLMNSGLVGDLQNRFLTKDELDAIFAAITGYLYLNNSTESVGDESGTIVIPKV